MAIKDWHGGQLIVLWIVLLLPVGFFVFLGMNAEYLALPLNVVSFALVLWGIPVVIVLTGLAITFRWFGGRHKNR